MPRKTTLLWISGSLVALLLALVVITGMQGQSSKVETQVDAHSPTATVER